MIFFSAMSKKLLFKIRRRRNEIQSNHVYDDAPLAKGNEGNVCRHCHCSSDSIRFFFFFFYPLRYVALPFFPSRLVQQLLAQPYTDINIHLFGTMLRWFLKRSEGCINISFEPLTWYTRILLYTSCGPYHSLPRFSTRSWQWQDNSPAPCFIIFPCHLPHALFVGGRRIRHQSDVPGRIVDRIARARVCVGGGGEQLFCRQIRKCLFSIPEYRQNTQPMCIFIHLICVNHYTPLPG